MLVPYGYFEIEKCILQKLYEALSVSQCIYKASDLMNALTYSDYKKFESAVIKAKNTCMLMQIPLNIHFNNIYISSPDGVYREYRLSRFACYLITVNADSRYPAVAKAHTYLVRQFK